MRRRTSGSSDRCWLRVSATTSSKMRLNTAGLPSPVPRSKPSVVMATFQPSFNGPTRLARGTRTLVKNTSAKRALPSICTSGRTSTPGECMSTRMKLIPLSLGAAGAAQRVEEGALPGAVALEGLAAGLPVDLAGVRDLLSVVGQPGADLVLEGGILGAELEVHIERILHPAPNRNAGAAATMMARRGHSSRRARRAGPPTAPCSAVHSWRTFVSLPPDGRSPAWPRGTPRSRLEVVKRALPTERHG